MKVHIINGAPEAIGPYAHATQSGNLIFCSGQTPLDPETMKLVGTTIEEQTERVLENLNIIRIHHPLCAGQMPGCLLH